jgi:hypothetical protein
MAQVGQSEGLASHGGQSAKTLSTGQSSMNLNSAQTELECEQLVIVGEQGG